jgi:predicted Zn-dependent peptidase
MGEKHDKYILKNGMVILGHPMPNVASAAFTILLPAGPAQLPEGCCGAAAVISDWIFRGAGARDSKQLIDALDGLGAHRSTSATPTHLSLSAALEASNLEKALPIYADIVLRPAIKTDQFELSKQLALHELAGLDDDPRRKVNLKLYEQFYPAPLGRPTVGKIDELQKLSPEITAQIIKDNFNLSQSIFAVAGKYDFHKVCAQLKQLFDQTQPELDSDMTLRPKPTGYVHEHHEGAQVHIGLMTPVPPITSEHYYNIVAAVSILSGGMSSRLFTEVREKRGLCYAVGARYNTLKTRAGISCYAGTTPENAQETIEVITTEFNRLAEGITENEMQRAKIGLKSTLIMHSESTSARAGAIASDFYLLDKVRSIQEIKESIEQISIDSVIQSLHANPFSDYTIVTIGPKPIEI